MILHQQSNTSKVIPFTLVSSTDHVSGATGKTATIKISKNGGSAITPSGTAAEINSSDMPGEYKFTPSAGDVDTLGSLKLYITAASCDPVSLTLIVVPFDPYSATRGFTGTALPTVATGIPGSVAVTDANSHVPSNVQQWNGNDVPGLVGGDSGYVPVQVASFANNAITAAALAADAGTEIAAAVWAAVTSGFSTPNSIGKLLVDNVDAAISGIGSGGTDNVQFKHGGVTFK